MGGEGREKSLILRGGGKGKSLRSVCIVVKFIKCEYDK